ncbi:fungal-specific transcription factor domain-containing protein [Irpex lacteus]|nr:fungal-specific transcription factor domain-containing protein [Irpex lacteus]
MRTVNKPQFYHLVALYFLEVNPFTPRDIEDNLHYRDEGFATSKKSNDPRVLLAEERIKNDNIRKGKVPETIEHHIGISFRPPSLYDMQVAYLAASYTVEASLSWNGIGYGLRIAQMLGVHRKKSYGTHPTVEGELRKRVFWALVLQDRAHSSVFGRACSIQDEEYLRLDLPIACDDEYWRQSDPVQAFKQPEDKPSKVAYFNCMLRLSQIHAYALRTIYSINKSKALLGLVGSDWQQKIVSQIDSALNRWLDSIPPHLRWDPKIEDNLFFKQSVSLHASYYNTCIIVHRPFIPSPRNPTPPSSPSLTICTHAARTCISLVEEEFKRTGEVNEQHSLFMSAIVLLINIWSEKKSTASSEAVREMQLVRRVMQMIKAMEPWGQGSAKIWDALNNLVRLSEMSAAEQASAGSKRPRGAPLIQPNNTSDPLSMGEREIAGSRRVRNYQQHQRQTLHKPSQTDNRHSINPTIVPSQLHSDDQFSMFAPTSGVGPEHDTSQATYSALSSGDAMMNPAIDPVMEALLSMLSPTQYQQPQVAPSSATGDFTPDTGDTHSSSAWDNAMLPNSSTAVATSGSQVDSLFPPVTSSKYDPSANWSSAPSGFGYLEDWEAYLTNVRQDGDDVLAEHTS